MDEKNRGTAMLVNSLNTPWNAPDARLLSGSVFPTNRMANGSTRIRRGTPRSPGGTRPGRSSHRPARRPWHFRANDEPIRLGDHRATGSGSSSETSESSETSG